jgi:hypothetical protein
MVWRAGVAVVCLFSVWAGTACAAELLACETQSANWKRREFRCPLTAKENGQQLRFKADFAGSHDDTQLSMTLTLDGAPVACSRDSKTWLSGEDGNVSLDCHFVLDGTAGTKRTLVATVNIWHAQIVAVELSAP